MNRSLHRIVALLLVPCFLADPSTAATPHSHQTADDNLSLFTQQALSLDSLMAHQHELKKPAIIKTPKRLGRLKNDSLPMSEELADILRDAVYCLSHGLGNDLQPAFIDLNLLNELFQRSDQSKNKSIAIAAKIDQLIDALCGLERLSQIMKKTPANDSNFPTRQVIFDWGHEVLDVFTATTVGKMLKTCLQGVANQPLTDSQRSSIESLGRFPGIVEYYRLCLSSFTKFVQTLSWKGIPQNTDLARSMNVAASLLPVSLGIHFGIEKASKNAKATAWVDPAHIVSVWDNLFANALTHGKSTRIDVSFQLDAEGRSIIDVGDDGGGIPAGIENKIFDKHLSSAGSTGLGLWISRQIVETAGGSITVLQTGPSGTTFRIIFPAAASVAVGAVKLKRNG